MSGTIQYSVYPKNALEHQVEPDSGDERQYDIELPASSADSTSASLEWYRDLQRSCVAIPMLDLYKRHPFVFPRYIEMEASRCRFTPSICCESIARGIPSPTVEAMIAHARDNARHIGLYESARRIQSGHVPREGRIGPSFTWTKMPREVQRAIQIQFDNSTLAIGEVRIDTGDARYTHALLCVLYRSLVTHNWQVNVYDPNCNRGETVCAKDQKRIAAIVVPVLRALNPRALEPIVSFDAFVPVNHSCAEDDDGICYLQPCVFAILVLICPQPVAYKSGADVVESLPAIYRRFVPSDEEGLARRNLRHMLHLLSLGSDELCDFEAYTPKRRLTILPSRSVRSRVYEY